MWQQSNIRRIFNWAWRDEIVQFLREGLQFVNNISEKLLSAITKPEINLCV